METLTNEEILDELFNIEQKRVRQDKIIDNCLDILEHEETLSVNEDMIIDNCLDILEYEETLSVNGRFRSVSRKLKG